MRLMIILFTLCALGKTSQMFDPYMICNDATVLPPPPPGRPPFLDHLSLCSTVHGVPGMNMGCFCDHPYGQVQCVEAMGDPYLWSATTILVDAESRQRTWVTLYDLCLNVCYCSSAAKGRAARNETGRLQKSHSSLVSETAENRSSVERVSGNTIPSSSSKSHQGTDVQLEQSKLQDLHQMTCGTNCSSNRDCQGGADGCNCKIQEETYIMGKGTVAFLASCMISLGGKREEGSPCPCNTSYVSHACCGVESGIIWEDESFKLGELMEMGKY